MKNFEDKFMEIQIDMISLALEYVQNQADKIFIYAIADSLYSFNLFYEIKGNIVHKHLVNDYLSKDSHVDISLQTALLKEGIKDVEAMIDICKEYDREHPTEMWLIYDAKKNSLDSRYSYEGRYDKDEELLPRLEFEKWFEEVKSKQLQEKKMSQFEDKFMEVQVSMISLAMEYVQNQAEKVYIYCISEEALLSFDVFYKINGTVTKMYAVNEIINKKVDTSKNMMVAVQRFGLEDIQKLLDVCQEYDREYPTEIWLIYDAKKNSLDSRYSYEGRYDKDEELIPRLEFEKWFEEVKGKQLQKKKLCPNKINQSSIPLPTDALLQEREVAWKVLLPEDYKELIIRKNGFRPSKHLFSFVSHRMRQINLSRKWIT